MLTRRYADAADQLIDFITQCATGLFPAPLNDVGWLRGFKEQLVQCAPYGTAASEHLAHPDLYLLSHVNLQVDNAFFWREDADSEQLECGLLDWYNVKRCSAVSVWGGCLSGCEPDVLIAHQASLFRAFARELAKYGGPSVDSDELLLMYRLSVPSQIVNFVSFIATEVLPQGPSRAEWPSITDRWDPRIMGTWQVRCRVIALVQLLGYWRADDIHRHFTEWVERQRPGIDRLPLDE